MASAVDHVLAVFETYELLENILLSLDPHEIFSIQRTCKSWQKLIERSVEIQKRIFAAPATDAVAPLPPPKHTLYTDVTYAHDLDLNVFIPRTRPTLARYYPEDDFLYLRSDFLYDPRAQSPTASHRQTCFTQPPCTTAFMGAHRIAHGGEVCLTIHDPSGISIGLLEDLAWNVATLDGTREAWRVKFWVGLSIRKSSPAEAMGVERAANEEVERALNESYTAFNFVVKRW